MGAGVKRDRGDTDSIAAQAASESTLKAPKAPRLMGRPGPIGFIPTLSLPPRIETGAPVDGITKNLDSLVLEPLAAPRRNPDEMIGAAHAPVLKPGSP